MLMILLEPRIREKVNGFTQGEFILRLQPDGVRIVYPAESDVVRSLTPKRKSA